MNLPKKVAFFLFYLRRPPWDTGVTPPEVVAFLQRHPPGRALDLGCGTGTNAIYMAQHGWQTVGVDFIGKAIRLARQKARKAGVKVTFILDDVTCLSGIHAPFDLVLDIGCFHMLSPSEKERYYANLLRLIAPQGFFLLYGFTRDTGGNARGLSLQDLQLLSSHLDLIEKQAGSDRGRPSIWFTYQRPIEQSPTE
jgi:cyclopropane fatty-acyl-phospholipid synthase-like methyltransferase